MIIGDQSTEMVSFDLEKDPLEKSNILINPTKAKLKSNDHFKYFHNGLKINNHEIFVVGNDFIHTFDLKNN